MNAVNAVKSEWIMIMFFSQQTVYEDELDNKMVLPIVVPEMCFFSRCTIYDNKVFVAYQHKSNICLFVNKSDIGVNL